MNALTQGLAIVIVVFLMLSIEAPLLQHIHLSSFAPDLALIAVLWVGLHMSLIAGVLTASAIGFLKDGFIMTVPIGMNMEILVVILLVSRFFASKLPVRGLATLVVTTVFLTVVSALLFVLLSLLFDKHFEAYRVVFRLMVPVALVTAPFAPVVFFLLDRLDGLFARAKQRDSLFG